MATRIGLEPTTPSVTGWCSNQLSYRAMIAQVSCGAYRRNVLYYTRRKLPCQAQIPEKDKKPCVWPARGIAGGKWAKTKHPKRLLRVFVAGVVSLELTARGFGDRCSTN